jgi:hypothetical protein
MWRLRNNTVAVRCCLLLPLRNTKARARAAAAFASVTRPLPSRPLSACLLRTRPRSCPNSFAAVSRRPPPPPREARPTPRRWRCCAGAAAAVVMRATTTKGSRAAALTATAAAAATPPVGAARPSQHQHHRRLLLRGRLTVKAPLPCPLAAVNSFNGSSRLRRRARRHDRRLRLRLPRLLHRPCPPRSGCAPRRARRCSSSKRRRVGGRELKGRPACSAPALGQL